jgi:hypothetical protein
MGEIVTVAPHACGKNQPFKPVEITRNHAIRCPRLMSEMSVPEKDWYALHVYPSNLPAEAVSYTRSKEHEHVCNVDLGNPEIPLVAEGMLTESWDGFGAGEIRHHTWKTYNDSVLMKRMRVIRFEL